MTTANQFEEYHETLFDEDAFPVFKSTFNAKTRHDLVEEDLTASRNVLGVLVTLVVIGTMLGIIGLIFSPGF